MDDAKPWRVDFKQLEAASLCRDEAWNWGKATFVEKLTASAVRKRAHEPLLPLACHDTAQVSAKVNLLQNQTQATLVLVCRFKYGVMRFEESCVEIKCCLEPGEEGYLSSILVRLRHGHNFWIQFAKALWTLARTHNSMTNIIGQGGGQTC